ncbi:hypothetical protein TELCIR_06222 [Teladorsagia circumcincta]|uniref:Uncharacterized protein n=1 Tax=Teladorsagia circumcincta TaxID=45464 RepID=A0A2G9UNQ9_TELCI|nr:hypothetical protein TELCIR_06222 [Teladorsagia circumcincta]
MWTLQAIEHSAKTPCGYATINNVNDHSIEDRMESFFLAETTKYLYLIFDQNNFLHNDGQKARIVDTPNGECVVDAGGYIFNTEAHPIDPAIVHCCSAQRQAEREAVRKWEDNYDLLTILDHRDTVSPMLLRKNIREDVQYLNDVNSSETTATSEEGIEFEVDESFIVDAPHSENESHAEVESKRETSEDNTESERASSESKEETNDFLTAITTKLPNKVATPPPLPQLSKKVFTFKGMPSISSIPRKEVLEKIKALIHKARLDDERKSENGEEANSAEELINSMAKIHEEYAKGLMLGCIFMVHNAVRAPPSMDLFLFYYQNIAEHQFIKDLIKQAKELNTEYLETMKRRAEKARAAAMVPVVVIACQVIPFIVQ